MKKAAVFAVGATLLACAAALTAGTPALASGPSLFAASVWIGYSDPYNDEVLALGSSTPLTFSYNGYWGSIQASAVTEPKIVLSAAAGGPDVDAIAQVGYDLYVTGAAGAYVPIDYVATATLSSCDVADYGYCSSAGMYVADGDGYRINVSLPNGVSSGAFTVAANTDNTVYEYAEAKNGSATADPYFYIDPNYASANPGDTLYVSSNVSNAPISGVPEPVTWALMCLGLAAIGCELRRARRRFTMLRAG